METELAQPDPYDRYFSPGFSTPRGFRSAPDKLKGKRVRILKATPISSMHPQDPDGWFPLKRTTVITVFGSSPGYLTDAPRYNSPIRRSYHPAELVWPGSGGYWKRVHLRDVELLDDVAGIPPVTAAQAKQFDDYLASVSLLPSAPITL